MHSFFLKYQLGSHGGDKSFLEPSSQSGNKLLFYIGPLRGNGRAQVFFWYLGPLRGNGRAQVFFWYLDHLRGNGRV